MSGRGPSRRNQAFRKRGLTPAEAQLVERKAREDRERWTHLFSLNKWQANPPAVIKAKRPSR